MFMCQIKQILTRMKAFCRRDPLKAISMCMHGLVEFVYIFWNLSVWFYRLLKKRRWTKLLFIQFSLFLICLEFCKFYAIGMLNAGMTMNAVAMNTGCSTRAIRHLRQRFQATGRTEDRPRSGRTRVSKLGQNRYIWTPTCAISNCTA